MLPPPGKQIYHTYFKEYNLVFTLIPKNANTSVKYSLIKTFLSNKYNFNEMNNNVDKFHASTLSLFNFIDNEELSTLTDCFRISIIRNPFSRLVSGWNDKIRNLTINNRKQRFGFRQGCSFEQFIKQISVTPDHKINRHFTHQHQFITYQDKLISDKILKFENLFLDWQELQYIIFKRNNINLFDLPNLNSTSNLNNKSYREYYTNETRKLVEKKFEKDLNMFNYEF